MLPERFLECEVTIHNACYPKLLGNVSQDPDSDQVDDLEHLEPITNIKTEEMEEEDLEDALKDDLEDALEDDLDDAPDNLEDSEDVDTL